MGELLSLAAALTWAVAVILFARSGETVPPLALNLFRVTTGALLLSLLLASGGSAWWRRAPAMDYLILAASGVMAISISDTLFHMSLNRVGAGISAIVDCLYAPGVVLLAFLLLGEHVRPWQLVGMVLVIASVVLASRSGPPRGTTRRTLLVGIAYGVLAMLALSLGIVIAKPVLDRSPVVWAATVRQLGALLGLLPVALARPSRSFVLAAFKPTRSWRFSLTGAVLGSFLALVLWIAGMKYTLASVAAILNQTSTIFILVLASLFLEERFTRRKALAALLALGGIVVVTLG